MLTIKVEVIRIDYEKCIRSLMERFQMKIQTWADAGLLGRLLEKLGGSAPDVFCCLSGYIPVEGKGMLISELANQYREKLTEASNKALASNELGKNIVFGQVGFGSLGEQLFISAQNVKVNYAGIMGNENVRKKVEDTAQQYLDGTALGKKLPGLGSLLKEKAGSAARLAAALAPGEVEKKALQLLASPENKEKLANLLEEMLIREGLVMEIGAISILKVGTDQKTDYIEGSGEQMPSDGKVPVLSAETEELLLDALSEYLKSSVHGGQASVHAGTQPGRGEEEAAICMGREEAAVPREVLQKIKATEVNLDKIRGGLLGGAVGDALGYPVEFLSEDEIRRRYGTEGIQEYELDIAAGQALISDDTQMSLFTADGILLGDTRGCLRGIQSSPSAYVYEAYKDWYMTQTGHRLGEPISWLLDIPELHSRRAPGNTCLSALGSRKRGSVKTPLNQSKGCGGIMRVAPLALHYHWHDRAKLDMEGAEIAALTHGHPLGYIPAAVLTHIVNTGVYGGCQKGDSLADAVEEAMETAGRLFAGNACLPELEELIQRAVAFAGNHREDSENIRELGEGWVAEETLAIAIYCSLRYSGDFSKGVTAAVNHGGDSDSTGAVTGNILGAWLGYSAIEEKWKRNLELSNIILEMADDLCHGCQLSEYSSYHDPVWESKYIEGKYKRQI